MSSRAWLALAVVAALVGAAWYALRARALGASSSPPLEADALLVPSSSSTEPPSIAQWRAAVVRASILYRDAVLAAALAIPRSTVWTEAQRLATVVADAATTDTRPHMRLRLAFLSRPPMRANAPAAVAAGPEAVATVRELELALENLRAAVELDPATYLPRALATGITPINPSTVDLGELGPLPENMRLLQ